VGYPRLAGNLDLRFITGEWTFNWAIDFLGHATDEPFIATETTANPHTLPGVLAFSKDYTEAVFYHTVSVRWTMDRWTVEGGIANLFDQVPPAVSSNEATRRGVSALPDYDLIGRRAFVDLKIAF
jgi:iron complex outermembrane recepter protein